MHGGEKSAVRCMRVISGLRLYRGGVDFHGVRMFYAEIFHCFSFFCFYWVICLRQSESIL